MVAVPWVPELRGITLPDAAVRLCQGQRTLFTGRGSLLFAHFGLSGPVILDLSREVSGHPDPQSLLLELDLVPARQEADLDECLRLASAAAGKKLLAQLLPPQARAACARVLLEAGLPADAGQRLSVHWSAAGWPPVSNA